MDNEYNTIDFDNIYEYNINDNDLDDIDIDDIYEYNINDINLDDIDMNNNDIILEEPDYEIIDE